MSHVCCLATRLASEPEPPQELHMEVERHLSCRDSPSWTRYRRLVSTLLPVVPTLARGVDDLSSEERALLAGASHAALFEFATPVGSGTAVVDNATGSSTTFAGSVEECYLGFATALFVHVATAASECSVVDRCLSDRDRERYLSLARSFVELAPATEDYSFPEPIAHGMVASSGWPIRRLELRLYSDGRGSGDRKLRGLLDELSFAYLARFGGWDPERLLARTAPRDRALSANLRRGAPLEALITTVDAGGMELACTLPKALASAGVEVKVHILVSGSFDWLQRFRRFEAGFIIVGAPADPAGRDQALALWASRSDVLFGTHPKLALQMLERFRTPTVLYLSDPQALRDVASRSEWQALRDCDALGVFAPLRCLLLAASPIVAEATLPRARILPPIVRPLCLQARPLPPAVVTPSAPQSVVLVLRPDGARPWDALLQSLVAPNFPLAFHHSPVGAVAVAAVAVAERSFAAVLFPWALSPFPLAELFAAELPIFAPSAEHLAQLPCARTAAGLLLRGDVAEEPQDAQAPRMWFAEGFATRTRCGTSASILSAASLASGAARARLVAELAESSLWPGIVRFDSVAGMFAELAAMSRRPGARKAVVRRMRAFVDEGLAEAARWWPEALLRLLADDDVRDGGPRSYGADGETRLQATPPQHAGPDRRQRGRGIPAAACHLPKPRPAAEDSPLRAHHRRALEFFAGFGGSLRRRGLRYALGLRTRLGAVTHGGLLPNERDLDVFVGALRPRDVAWRRREVLQLCRLFRALVDRNAKGRHRYAVLCPLSRRAKAAQREHAVAMSNGHVPMCPAAFERLADAWFGAGRSGLPEADAVAIRIVRRSRAGLLCISHALNVHASDATLARYGPACGCRWEGVAALCLALPRLRDHFDEGIMSSEPVAPLGFVPCGEGLPAIEGIEGKLAPEEQVSIPTPVEQSPRMDVSALLGSDDGRRALVERFCWSDGFEPYVCCHPQYGAEGLQECWGGHINAEFCCDERAWSAERLSEFHMFMQTVWARRCDGRRNIYGDDRPRSWKEGVFQELLFWFAYLKAGAKSSDRRHALEVAAALDTATPLEERLRDLLSVDEQGRRLDPPSKVRILDVGAGPISLLGYVWEGVEVDVVASDALACEYSEMRKDLGFKIPRMAVPVVAEAETLAQTFGVASFDLVVCTNALDHAYDPMHGVTEMLRVVRPGRPILIRHNRNEAVKNNFAGLHQWNWDLRDGRLLLWTRASGRGGGAASGGAAAGAVAADVVGPATDGRVEIDVAARLVELGLVDALGGVEARPIPPPYVDIDPKNYTGQLEWIEAVMWGRRG